jgi:hypothetical protein
MRIPSINENAIGRRAALRYTLGALFIAVTAMCVWLGFAANKAAKQRRAIAVIKQLNGIFKYDYDLDDDTYLAGSTVGHFPEPEGPTWLRDLIGNEYFDHIRYVHLAYRRATDQHVAIVAQLPHLGYLDLTQTDVTDRGLEQLARCKRLRTLRLDNTRVTEQGVLYLRSLTSLRTLSVRHCPGVTDETVSQLREALPECDITHQW